MSSISPRVDIAFKKIFGVEENKDLLSILDIKAEGETGEKFNIEIQITDEADYDKRASYHRAEKIHRIGK